MSTKNALAEAREVLLSRPERRILGSVDNPRAFIVADPGPGSDGTPYPSYEPGKFTSTLARELNCWPSGPFRGKR